MKKYFYILFIVTLFSCTSIHKGCVKNNSDSNANNKNEYPIVFNNDSIKLSKIKEDILNVKNLNKEIEYQINQEESSSSSDDLLSLKGEEPANKIIDKNNNIKIIHVKNTKVVQSGYELSNGRIVYKIPEKMKVLSTYRVIVRISKSKSIVSVYDSLSDIVRTTEIPITETMEVKLKDLSAKEEKAFEIIDENNAVQMVDSGDTYTEWSWSVTPIRVGNSKLEVVVSAIRGDARKDIVYEDTVDVEKDIWVQIIFLFKEYWHYILSSIIVPFGIWLYKSRKEKNKV